MLKITKVADDGTTVHLKLEGKVTAQWAALLDGECRAFLRGKKAVVLDCADVNFLDERGVDVLRNLPFSEVTMIGAPGFNNGMTGDGKRHFI